MNPVAAIIIPLKRQNPLWLDQCLRSALSQSVLCEVIVVTSETTPRSNLRVLEDMQVQFENLCILIEKTPDSFPGAINLGIHSASAGRIGLLLSDDWLDADAVAHCLQYSADIVCTGQTTYYEDGITINEAASQTPTTVEYHSLPTMEAKASYLEHFFLFQKKALLAVGGLDESIGNYPGIDDYDLIWMLLEQGASVHIVEKRLYNYRDHDGERLTLADAQQAARNLEKILRKHSFPQADLQRMVKLQTRWFGRPIYKVLADAE